ncbi:MAG: hypothetical protein HQL58_08645 [Magnetococcales bacterium]|nr:hypothetical protein [Magnetococcales bacterium]
MAVYGFLQARLQAHHALHLDEAGWQRLIMTDSFELFLTRARGTVLNRWLETVEATGDIHHLELKLLEQLLHYIGTVASWAPSPWRAAVLWTGSLPDLAVHLHRQGGGAVHGWMATLEDSVVPRTLPTGVDPVVWWLQQWRRLWPRQPDFCRHLEQLTRLVQHYLEQLARLEGHESAQLLGRQLQDKLVALFRRHTMQPAALFSHLLLVALELDRLRGELSRRRLFHSDRAA